MFLPAILLSTFISVNGQVMEVPAQSNAALQYETETVTDIGNPDNLNINDTLDSTLSNEPDVSSELLPVTTSEPIVSPTDNNDVVMLNEVVELLSENSSSAIGTLNNSVLNLMDRIVDNIPDYYSYVGFKNDTDDSYSATLYIGKRADVTDNTIVFDEDCIAINFYRDSYSGYNNYIYYDISDTPGASVNISEHSIVYTNTVDYYPGLGTVNKFPSDILWIALVVALAMTLLIRRSANVR